MTKGSLQEPGVPEAADREERVRRVRLLREQRRRAARDSLMDYVHWTFPTYRAGRHHLAIAAALERVERGEVDRLMLFAPPRHGKSTLASVRFPAWYLGRHPTREIIAASYGGELIAGFGARLRNLVGSAEHREVFGERSALSSDVRARDRWLTKAGGVYRAAGVGAGITGFGAHVLLIDDPVKSREDADSDLMRNKVWDWFQNEAYTRLMKGGSIVVIMTRWHEDDLAGRLLEEDGADEWEVLRFPAVGGAGEALWPEEYPLPALDRIRRQIGPRAWQALYQGDPAPDDGTFFKESWFRRSETRWRPQDARDGRIRTYAATDHAVTAGAGDYTVHAVVGVDDKDDIHVLDMWRRQATPDVWVDAMLDLAAKWRPLMWAEGRGGLQRAVAPLIAKRQRERGVFFARMTVPETRDKKTRAQAFQGRMAMGHVHWAFDTPWFPAARAELLSFDVGKNDDIVDALSLVGRMLDGMTKGRTPKPAPEPGIVLSIGRSAERNLPKDMRAATWRDIVGPRGARGRRRRMNR